MKKFTYDQIKEFCKTHYEEYFEDPDIAILFDFVYKGQVKKTSFASLAKDAIDLTGVWVYDSCEKLGDDIYLFKFKRTA